MLETTNGERHERIRHCLGVEVVLNFLKEAIDEVPEASVGIDFDPGAKIAWRKKGEPG